MTQSVPDEFPTSISFEELKRLKSNAPNEQAGATSTDTAYKEKVETATMQILDDITDRFDDELHPKLLLLYIIKQMIGWAEENRNSAAQANDLSSFAGFTAIITQLCTTAVSIENIYLGENDFMHPANASEE